MAEKLDKEIQEFRDLMTVPSEFKDGFNITSLLGAVFLGLLMVPGAIYMGLLAGTGIGPAAQWVTVILFIEVAKRAHRNLNRSEVFVLFFMAGAMMSGMGMNMHANVPHGLLWQQFYVRSDAALAAGITDEVPHWWAPPVDSEVYGLRTFFHWDWLPAIGLALFVTFFGQLENTILSYGLFRLASDIEKLPFPMAPIGAQGIIALAQDNDAKQNASDEDNWRWRVFSIGGALGLGFGTIYLLLPTLTGALTGTPIQIFPIPFSDFTSKTQDVLPAVATGFVWDLGILITGMVMPFFAMLGSFIGLIITFVLNPLLYEFDILSNWTRGDDTVTTIFKNNIDFYFSFQIGVAVAIAIAGIYKVVVSLKNRKAELGERDTIERAPSVPEGRGDIPTWLILACYFSITSLYILLSGWLIDWHPGIMVVLLFLGFVYTPLISFVTARLEGMVGQAVEIPFIREACLIFSGYQGVACWFLPLPKANYGMMTVFYRQCELTGTKFTSIWKTKIILYPIVILFSIVFMNFIWSLAEVPSNVYPFAQLMWPLKAKNASIMFSATMGGYSMFEEAFNGYYLITGAVVGVILFALLANIGAPVMLTYGVVRGLNQSMPHVYIPQFCGALLGKFYFQRKLGVKWRQYIPVVAAGYACGAGLVTTLGVGITFLSKAVVQMPF